MIKKGSENTASIIKINENNFKVVMPKFLQRFSLRLARDSFNKCHNESTKSNLTIRITMMSNFIKENNMFSIKDQIINGL